MTVVPIDPDPASEVSRLAALARGPEQVVTLTEDGQVVAVMVDPQYYQGLVETLDILSTPGEREEIDAGRAELAEGLDVDGPTALAKYLNRGGNTRPITDE